MKGYAYISFLCLTLMVSYTTQAQNKRIIYYSVEITNNDTIINALLPETTVFAPMVFKTEKEYKDYAKLVRDVKKTLPYAKLVSKSIIEIYEFMETLPDKKAQKKHLEASQKYLMEEYKPKMKKLTKNQGKILFKLIDRETNTSTYNIVKALIGPFKATLYNSLAGLFGHNMKTEYDPEGKDWMIERIVIEIEQGTL
jgi:hypothetical protein